MLIEFFVIIFTFFGKEFPSNRYIEKNQESQRQMRGSECIWGEQGCKLLFHHLHCGTVFLHKQFLHHNLFFFLSCCSFLWKLFFLVAVLFYPPADWCRLYVFPPETRQPTRNHLLISTLALFISFPLNSYTLRNCSSVSVFCVSTFVSRSDENNLRRHSSAPRVIGSHGFRAELECFSGMIRWVFR